MRLRIFSFFILYSHFPTWFQLPIAALNYTIQQLRMLQELRKDYSTTAIVLIEGPAIDTSDVGYSTLIRFF